MDESDLKRLGVKKIEDAAEIQGHQVKVVGIMKGCSSPAGAHVFCSIETAQTVLHLAPGQVNYILGRCHDPADAPAVVERLQAAYPQLSVFTKADLSLRSRLYWLIKTKGGLAMGYIAVLGLLVGAVVTGQTLYSATVAQLRGYAVLWALGVPVRRLAALVVAQAFWVGVAGVLLSFPVTLAVTEGRGGSRSWSCSQAGCWPPRESSPCSWPWSAVWQACACCGGFNPRCCCARRRC